MSLLFCVCDVLGCVWHYDGACMNFLCVGMMDLRLCTIFVSFYAVNKLLYAVNAFRMMLLCVCVILLCGGMMRVRV